MSHQYDFLRRVQSDAKDGRKGNVLFVCTSPKYRDYWMNRAWDLLGEGTTIQRASARIIHGDIVIHFHIIEKWADADRLRGMEYAYVDGLYTTPLSCRDTIRSRIRPWR